MSTYYDPSRVEQILKYGLGEISELPPSQSRVEDLLIQLILQGGGGGTTNYNLLSNKPQIAGTTLQGNVSLEALGISSMIATVTGENLILSTE